MRTDRRNESISPIVHVRRLANRTARRAAEKLENIGSKLRGRNWGKTAAGRALIDAVLYPADIFKVASRYKDTFGRYPRLLRPSTFNEWLQTAKLIRRKRRYTQFADKLSVRDFVRERVGEEVLPRIYWSGTNLWDARQLSLPQKFAVKSNHGSGMNLLVSDRETFDWQEAQNLTQQWLASDYSKGVGEWQYRWIEPKIFIEEFLEDSAGQVPVDYKLFCFRGRVELIQVDCDRFTHHTRLMLDRRFNVLPFEFMYPKPDQTIYKPECLDQMIRIAETLSENEPFLRVDMYDLGRPIFGELTLHPEAGLGHFSPSEWDERLFAMLRMGNA
jgi:hypothetical protein